MVTFLETTEMRTHMLKPLILALGLSSIASLVQANESPGIIRAAVSEVIDGDTFVIEQSGIPMLIDLESIDAPEINQHYGQEAKDFLSQLLLNKNVKIKTVKTVDYRHVTAFVTLEDLDVNKTLVKSGLAWYDAKNGYDSLLKTTQNDAKKFKLGLWSQKSPVAPWDYRDGPKEAFKLPTLDVSYEPEAASTNGDETVGEGNNAQLDQILGAKVPEFTPPPALVPKSPAPAVAPKPSSNVRPSAAPPKK